MERVELEYPAKQPLEVPLNVSVWKAAKEDFLQFQMY